MMKTSLLKICLASTILLLGARVDTVRQIEMYSRDYVPFTKSTFLERLDSEATLKFTLDDELS